MIRILDNTATLGLRLPHYLNPAVIRTRQHSGFFMPKI
nr:MAG TPA: hypothetical protein [Caudoviricetes sp.]